MYRHIDINKIICSRKSDKIQLFYEKKGKPLYLQLSKGYLGKKIDENTKYIWLGYYNESKIKNTTFNYLSEVKNIIEKQCDIKIEQFFYDNGIGIPLQNVKGKLYLEIYMRQNDEIWNEELLNFPEKSYVVPIIYLDDIICKNNKWYLNYRLVQVCVYPIFQKFGKCMVDEMYDLEINKKDRKHRGDTVSIKTVDRDYVDIKLIEHPVYGKYFKMVQMGVPRPAVRLKMINELGDRYKENILDKNPNDLEKIKLVKVAEHPSYDKYFKMIKMGVPRVAVEQKMNINGLECMFLDKGDDLIMEIEVAKKCDIFGELKNKKLRNIEDRILNTHPSDITATKPVQKTFNNLINMDELLKRRDSIFKLN